VHIIQDTDLFSVLQMSGIDTPTDTFPNNATERRDDRINTRDAQRYGFQDDLQTQEPSNPSSDYSEVQGNTRNAQSSAADEAEAGVKVRSVHRHLISVA
jgi:hypothetical protein